MKSILKHSVYIIILLGIFFPSFIYAADLRMETEVILDASSVVSDNLYVGAGRARIGGQSKADTSVIAVESILSGVFGEDVISVSLSTLSEGTFNEDVRIVGPDVTVTGTVNGDLFVVGGNVRITESAKLNGDLVVVGGKVSFKGTLNGKAKIVAGFVNIDGSLLDRSTITTQKLTLGEKALIEDTLFYFSPSQADTDPSAVIKKPLKYNSVSKISDSQIWERFIVNVSNFWIVLKFITTLFVSFVLVFVFRVFTQSVASHAERSFWKMALTGLISFILIPFAAVVCMVSLFALPVGIILLFMYMIMFLLIPAISGIIAGMFIWNWINKRQGNLQIGFQTATFGVIVLTFLQFIPYIGGIVNLVLFFVSMGVIVYYIYSNIRGGNSLKI